jgi:hydrogenase maturation protease
MKKIGVIGIGNPLRRDDGIGIILLEQVQKHKKKFPNTIEFIDGGTGGMNLLHVLARFDTVLIIDAVRFKGKPGEIHLFFKNDLLLKKSPIQIVTHEQDFLQILRLSEELKELPDQVLVFGVQPKDVSAGTGLSKDLETALPNIFTTLVLEIQLLIIS